MSKTEVLPASSRLWKLVPLASIVTVCVLLAAAAGVGLYYERTFKQQSLQEAVVQARVLASTVTAALVFNDRDAAQEYVDALRANPEIEAVAVYDDDGQMVARLVRGRGAPPQVAPADGTRFESDLINVVLPVWQMETRVGTVYFSTVIEPLGARLARYAVMGLIFVMAALAVAVLGVAHSAMRNANLRLADLNGRLLAQIAEREKAEEALRQSQKMEALGQLSGGIAHDFNNFLTIIKNSLFLMERRLSNGASDVSRYMAMANEGVNRATRVTQRILAFSRRQALTPKSVDLRALVEGLAPLLRNSVGPAITIHTRLASDCWAFCDENQMENAVLNLLVNARDAMPQGGDVTIRVESYREAGGGVLGLAAGEYVKFSVKDTGGGMTEEVRRRAVDPFFTTKPEGQGTGLGLSMIYGFVAQSQGQMQIDSAPGAGTTIALFLPRHHQVREAGQQEMARPAPADATMASRIPTVLVVEDEELVRSVVVESLRERGYKVMEEGDGDTAARLLEADVVIDLLISDIKLPGMNGAALAQQALRLRPGIKTVLVTGYHQEPIPPDLIKAGLKVFYKPYTLTELLAYAEGLLNDMKSG